MHDLAKLPETFPELAKLVERVMRVLVVFKGELDQDQLEEDEMEALRDIDAAYEAWERRVKAEGDRAGFIRAIRTLCHSLEIELTDERIAQLAKWDDEQLVSTLSHIGKSRNWPHS